MVTQRVPVYPPEVYLQPCPVGLGDLSVQGALAGLRAALDCEQADKAALRAWAAEQREESGEQRTEKRVLPQGG